MCTIALFALIAAAPPPAPVRTATTVTTRDALLELAHQARAAFDSNGLTLVKVNAVDALRSELLALAPPSRP